MYSNEVDLTLTAWSDYPQVVVRVWGAGRGIATQEWDEALMEERAFPYASPLTFSVDSGPMPEFPPWGYIGLSVHLAPGGNGAAQPRYRTSLPLGLFCRLAAHAFPHRSQRVNQYS